MSDEVLEPIPVDLEALAWAMEKAYRNEYFLDLENGDVVSFEPTGYRSLLRRARDAVEEEREDELDWQERAALARAQDPDRFARVPRIDTREAYEARAGFARSIEDGDARRDLLRALEGKGAFSRFQRALECHDGLREAWYERKNAWHEEVTRRWLRGIGVEPVEPEREV